MQHLSVLQHSPRYSQATQREQQSLLTEKDMAKTPKASALGGMGLKKADIITKEHYDVKVVLAGYFPHE